MTYLRSEFSGERRFCTAIDQCLLDCRGVMGQGKRRPRSGRICIIQAEYRRRVPEQQIG